MSTCETSSSSPTPAPPPPRYVNGWPNASTRRRVPFVATSARCTRRRTNYSTSPAATWWASPTKRSSARSTASSTRTKTRARAAGARARRPSGTRSSPPASGSSGRAVTWPTGTMFRSSGTRKRFGCRRTSTRTPRPGTSTRRRGLPTTTGPTCRSRFARGAPTRVSTISSASLTCSSGSSNAPCSRTSTIWSSTSSRTSRPSSTTCTKSGNHTRRRSSSRATTTKWSTRGRVRTRTSCSARA